MAPSPQSAEEDKRVVEEARARPGAAGGAGGEGGRSSSSPAKSAGGNNGNGGVKGSFNEDDYLDGDLLGEDLMD